MRHLRWLLVIVACAAIPRLDAQFWQQDTSFNPVFETSGPASANPGVCALPDGSVLVNYANSFYINGQNPGALAHITASGNLDTSFSVSEFSFAFALYVYPNGSLLIQGMFAGDSSGNYYICRLLPNGSLDPTFTSFELNAGSSEIMARVQADGRILVWGKVVSLNLPQELALMRLNSDGSLDPTFTPIAAQSSMVQDVEQQADGKLLVAGQISFPPNTSYYMFLRLNTDGSVDSSFSTSFVGPDSSSNVGQWLAPLANGEILACGGMGIARLTSSGTVDTGYTAALPSSYQSISQLGLVNGVVYFVELASSSNQELYRLNADGTLDTSFVITAPYAVTYSVGIPVTWGGTTLYFGTALTSTRWQSRFTLSQTSSGGVLNAGFSPRFSKPAVPYTARQSDGKYLVAGSFDYVNGVNLGASPLARLNNDGTLDTTFNTAIDATTASSIRSMIEQPDGHIVAVVYAESTYLMRFNSDGSSDTTFPSTQCYAAKSDSSGNLYIEVKDPAGSGNILERLSPTGVLDPTFSTADMNIQQIIGATSDGMVVLAVLNPFTALIRLTNSGAVDPAFTVSYSAPGDQTFCVLPDNSVLAAGSTQPRNAIMAPRSHLPGTILRGNRSTATRELGRSLRKRACFLTSCWPLPQPAVKSCSTCPPWVTWTCDGMARPRSSKQVRGLPYRGTSGPRSRLPVNQTLRRSSRNPWAQRCLRVGHGLSRFPHTDTPRSRTNGRKMARPLPALPEASSC